MVQHNDPSSGGREWYWKLNWPRHSESGNDMIDISSTDRVFIIDSRKQRNMLIYDHCTPDELRAFCTRRGLETPEPACTLSQVAAFRVTCTTRLENLDDNECTFERFLDLPPELRLNVYGWYHLWLSDYVWHYRYCECAPPPITAVSRAVREESIPIFCDHVDFYTYGTDGSGPLTMSPGTRKFFAESPDIFFRSVRLLRIHSRTSAGPVSCRVKWDFDLRGKTSAAVVESIGHDQWDSSRAAGRSIEQIERALGEHKDSVRKALMDLADRMIVRPGFGFKREDADSIVEALNARPSRDQAIDSQGDAS